MKRQDKKVFDLEMIKGTYYEMKCYSFVLYLHGWYAVTLQCLRIDQISLLISILIMC